MRLVTLLPALLAASAAFSTASADTLPVGLYAISAHTTTTGIHQSADQGTLSGFLNFSATSVLTSANLVFSDTTTGMSYTFTVPGATEYIPQYHITYANIYNATNPASYYAFSAEPSTNGNFRLTCGTDCDTDLYVYDSSGKTEIVSVELQGSLTPAPEPSSIALLGTGMIAIIGVLRRRLLA